MARPITITNYGLVQTSAEKKWGSYSIYMDGTSIGNSEYAVTASTTDLNLGSGDWTIEFWARSTESTVQTDSIVLFARNNDNRQWTVNFTPGASNTGGVSMNHNNLSPNPGHSVTATISANTWYHCAVVKYSNQVKCYIDGVGGTANSNTLNYGAINNVWAIHIGGFNYGDSVITNTFDGYVDNIRVSNTARYTADFSPPAGQLTSDANTLWLPDDENTTSFLADQLEGQATLASTASISVSAIQTVSPNTDLLPYTWDTVPNDTWADFVFDRWVVSGVLFSSTATLAASAQILINASAGLTVTASLSADALRVKLGSAGVNSSAQLTVAAGILLNAASGLNVLASQSTQAVMTRGGASGLVSQVTQVVSATLELAGASALNTSATQVVSGRLLKFASLFLDGFATLGAAAGLNKTIASGLNTTATVAATANVTLNANVALSVTATQVASAGLNKNIASGLNSTAVIAVSGTLFRNASATLGAVAQLTATEAKQVFGQSQLNTTVALTSGATVIKNAGAQLTVLAFELSVGKIIRNGSASLGVTAQFTGDIDLVLLSSDFILRVLPETRQYTLDSESRIQGVLSDTRQYRVGSESRNHRVLPETRTISSEDFLIG